MHLTNRMLVAAAALAPCLAAQTTLLVGPSRNYTDLPQAIAAASPGDHVLVEAGGYSAFTLDKALLVRAEPVGATVSIQPTNLVRIEVPHGAFATLQGLTFDANIVVQRSVGATLAGTAALVDANVRRGILLDHAELAVWRSQVTGLGRCIDVQGTSTLSVSQSAIIATTGAWLPTIEGIYSAGQARIQVSNSTVRGGAAGFHSIAAASPAVRLSGNDRASFVDCTLDTFQQSILYTQALVSTSSHPVNFDRCTFTDSLGQPNGTVGALQNRLVLGLSSTGALTRGSTFTLDFASRPQHLVVAHARFDLGNSGNYSFVDGPDFGFVTGSMQFALRIADAQGNAQVAVAVPNAPWLQDVNLWFGGWSELGLPVQMSALIGGPIR